MEYLFERVFLLFYKSVGRHLEVAVLHKVGHDFLGDDLLIFLGLQTVDELHLQLGEFLAVALLTAQLHQLVFHHGIDRPHIFVQRQHPSYECTLPQVFILRLLIDIEHDIKFPVVEDLYAR